ncbi:MAG TPA: M48 family metallopeptidase [Terracidiphilus sp.]|jgi:Zn-dependent protease with chaperone function
MALTPRFFLRLPLALLVPVLLAGLAPLPLASQASAGSPNAPSASAGPREQANPAQAYNLPPDRLAKAIALSRIRNILDVAGSIWGIVFLWLLLATRGWSSLEAWAVRQSRRGWVQGLLFFAAYFVITTLAGLPFDLYGHHAERSYGVSVQTWGSWFGDAAKGLGLSLVFGTLLLLFFHWIVRVSPRRYWLWIWLATLPLMLLAVFAEPLIIDPLFNHFQPLAKTNPALVQQLERVAQRTGTDIPPDRMFLMNASEKTNGLNAYVTGIGASKRIVVWDTTAGRIPNDEVLFIFGHESGHYVLHHIPKGLALTAVSLFFIYWACAAVAAGLIRRVGPRWGAPDLASRTGFVLLLFTISIAGFALEPVANAVSRHFEHQADVYGQEAVHGIVPDPQRTAVAAFNDLGKAWLEDPNPSPFIEFWLYNHPSTQSRANFALHYDPWANGGHGKFFKK